MKRRFLSAVLILCMVLTLIPISALTATAATVSGACTCGSKVTSSFDKSTGTLVFSGSGTICGLDPVDNHYPVWADYGDAVKKIVINEGITDIGNYGSPFGGYTNLASVSISGSVKHIAPYAFAGCTKLTDITLPKTGNLTSISLGAFYGCTALTSFTVPSKVTEIDSFAFLGCTNLKSIYFEGNAPAVSSASSTIMLGGGEEVTADSFEKGTATLYYQSGKTGWTSPTWNGYATAIRGGATLPTPPTSTILKKDGDFEYLSSVTGKTEEYNYSYDESWFYANSSIYQHGLAKMSIRLALAAARQSDVSVKKLFTQLEFENSQYEFGTPGTDTIGYAIGSKNITNDSGEKITLIAVAIRGGGYAQEWASNFTIGAASEHAGFAQAANTVTAAVDNYIKKIGANTNIKIWITGYSRAAATANVAAQRLTTKANSKQIAGLSADGNFTYCFECPRTVTTSDPSYMHNSYKNIFNIVNYIDVVTKVAPADWGYSRYGITYCLPSAEQSSGFAAAHEKELQSYYNIIDSTSYAGSASEKRKQALVYSTHMVGQGAFTDKAVGKLASFFDSSSAYSIGYESTMRSIFKKLGGGSYDAGTAFGALVEGLPAFAIFHPVITSKMLSNKSELGYAHYPELCLAWMDSLSGKSDYADPRTRMLRVNCPVDISVYNESGDLVARVIDDKVQSIGGSTICAYIDEDGQKILSLPTDSEYTVQVTATDNGAMSYQVEEHNAASGGTERLVNYYDVPITAGEKLTGTVENLSGTAAASYSLSKGNGKKIEPSVNVSGKTAANCTLTVIAEGNGNVTGGGSYVPGEYAKVTAVANSGGEFLGWYLNGKQVSIDASYRLRVEKDLTLTAKFTEGGEWKNPFIDVKESDWFYGDVKYVCQNGLFNGTSNTVFGPNVTMTRAMLVTVLHRLEDFPESKTNAFADVPDGSWYANAVSWAAANGIVEGMGNNQFRPNSEITREQMAAILYRYAKHKGYDVTTTADLSKFKDSDMISGYAVTSMSWANAGEFITGKGDGILDPGGYAKRCQVAAILHRFCETFAK